MCLVMCPFHNGLLHRYTITRCKRVTEDMRCKQSRLLFLENESAELYSLKSISLTSILSIFLLNCWEDCHANPTKRPKIFALNFSTRCLLVTTSPVGRRSFTQDLPFCRYCFVCLLHFGMKNVKLRIPHSPQCFDGV